MAKASDVAESSDPFEIPAVAEMWAEVAEIVDDPTAAKDAIRYLAGAMWNLPWPVWQQLQEASGS